MKGGAYDYFEKPLKVEEVVTSLREAQRRAERWNELFKRHSTAASQGASSEGL
jgi:DNA-binding NtrC family response regulator